MGFMLGLLTGIVWVVAPYGGGGISVFNVSQVASFSMVAALIAAVFGWIVSR